MKSLKHTSPTPYVMFWLTPRDPHGFNPHKALQTAKKHACRRQQIPPQAVELVRLPDAGGYLAACARRVRTDNHALVACHGAWSKPVPAVAPVDYGERPIAGSAPPAVQLRPPRRKDPYKNRPLD